jgi:hypothetical protein
VQVFSSPAGTAVGELKLDLQDPAFKIALAQVSGVNPDLQRRTEFGRTLFSALFNSDVLNTWNNSWGRVAGGAGAGLRLSLLIEDEALSFIPWELLQDPVRGFIAVAADSAVSRYLPVQEPPLAVLQKPLRVMVVIESPNSNGLAPISEEEQLNLKQALDSIGNAVSYEILLNPSIERIQTELQKDPHVIHFLGHGTSGKLVFVTDAEPIKIISDAEFATLFLGRRSVRLAVLNACFSSKAEDGGLFSGIGPALVRAGLPAVVAMQYPTVQLDSAGIFSRAMYRALANGLPVDVAVNEGRNLVAAGPLLASRDWSTPVLYLGTRSGRILDFDSENKEVVEDAWHNVEKAARESGALAALTQLSQRFRELAQQHRSLQTWIEAAMRVSDLRVAYSSLTELVEEAQGDPARLRFPAIRQSWQSFIQNHWQPFVIFVEAHDELNPAGWYSPLLEKHDAIAASVKTIALMELQNRLIEFGELLSKTEAYLRFHSEEAVTNLISLSDQTLPLLTVGQQ